VLVLAWAALSGTPWRDLGFVRPRRWPLTVLTGVAAGAGFKLAMKSIVMPLLGAPPLNQAYRDLTGNAAALPGMVLMVVIGAGFGEEVLFRGYLFERFTRWFGRGPGSSIAAVLVTSLVFASVYARTRALPFVMIVHTAFDLTAVWLIYNAQESAVAHWFFR
jgi:membrane protease YdiL (CAAX protease family)